MPAEFLNESKYPHIVLDKSETIVFPSGNVAPLCNLKLMGSCQGIPVKFIDGKPYWLEKPSIQGCQSCTFHKTTCTKSHDH